MADYSLNQLEALTGLAARTIRFYIQKGLVQPPFGARKTPRYTEQHVEQLLQVKAYKEAGLNLSRIADLLSNTGTAAATAGIPAQPVSVISRLALMPGVTLDIDRAQCALSDDQIRTLYSTISDTVTALQGGDHEQ